MLQELWVESVPPAAASGVMAWLVRTLRYTPADARRLVDAAPLPCATGDETSVAAWEEALVGLGARVRRREVRPGAPPCAAHPRVRGLGTCEDCHAAMCLLCNRASRPGLCAACAEARRRGRAGPVAAGVAAIVAVAIATPLVVRSLRPASLPQESPDAAVAIAAPATAPRLRLPARTAPMPDRYALADAGPPADASPAPAKASAPASGPTLPREAEFLVALKAGDHPRMQALLEAAFAVPADPDTGARWARLALRAAVAADQAGDAAWRDRHLELALAKHYGAARGDLLTYRARLALAAGRLDAAVRDLREAGDGDEALSLLADALHRQGDVHGATEAWRRLAQRPGRLGEAARKRLEGQAAVEAGLGEYGERSSTHFRLRYPLHPRGGSGDQLAQDILQVMERGYDRVTSDVPAPPGEPIQVVAYEAEDFVARFGGHSGFVLLGVYVPRDRTIVVNDVVTNSADAMGSAVLVHELTHAVLDRIVGGRPLPVWLNEGLARYEERRAYGGQHTDDLDWLALQGKAKRGELPPLRSLTHRYGACLIAYDLGAAVMTWVHEHDGFPHLQTYLADIRRGRPHPDAFRAAFGVDEATFERQFLDDLAHRSTGGWSAP